MPCYYCAQEDFRIDDYGNCVVCQVAVCVNPSGRWDSEFHGEVCICQSGGCGRLVCEKHLLEHAHAEHRREDGSRCFPGLWIAVGGGGVRGGAAMALQPERRYEPERRHDLDRFLNVVRPGHQAMRWVAENFPSLAVAWPGEWGAMDERKVILYPERISRPVAETIAAHAADAMGAAAEPFLDYPGIPPGMADIAKSLNVFPEQLRHSLDALAHWHRDGARLDPEALQPWLPDDAPPGFATRMARAIDERRPEDPWNLAAELVRSAGVTVAEAAGAEEVAEADAPARSAYTEHSPGVTFEEVVFEDESDEPEDLEHPGEAAADAW